ncbi:hypothetical protein BZA77DRAFT_294696 [Pyronema omphalodes]|nr:hypothetical protein BZA77DRAFT_294696 [Pyronema omphalodes]
MEMEIINKHNEEICLSFYSSLEAIHLDINHLFHLLTSIKKFNNSRSENQTTTDTMPTSSTRSEMHQADDAGAPCPPNIAPDAVNVTSRPDELPSRAAVEEPSRTSNSESQGALQAAREQDMLLGDPMDEVNEMLEKTLLEQQNEAQLFQPKETKDEQLTPLQLGAMDPSQGLSGSTCGQVKDRFQSIERGVDELEKVLLSRINFLESQLKNQEFEHQAVIENYLVELDDQRAQMSILCQDLDKVHKEYQQKKIPLTMEIISLKSQCAGLQKICDEYHQTINALKKEAEIRERDIEIKDLAKAFDAKKRVDKGTQTTED